MESVARMIVAATDLVEAEGRMLRRQVVRVCMVALALLASVLLGLFGLAFVLYGVFWLLAERMSNPAASAIFGVLLLGLAGGLTWLARRAI